MKKFILSLLSFCVLSTSAFAAEYPAGNYEVDPMHSKVGFEISHLVISTVEGSFSDFSGTVNFNKDFSKSQVTAKVNVGSIATGVVKRDNHLKDDDFFAAKKFPEMTFTSSQITGTPEKFTMKGELTIHGVKKPITFEGKYLGAVKDQFGNEKVAFNATGKLNRKDFGLTWSKVVEVGPVVGDEVEIELKIQAKKV